MSSAGHYMSLFRAQRLKLAEAHIGNMPFCCDYHFREKFYNVSVLVCTAYLLFCIYYCLFQILRFCSVSFFRIIKIARSFLASSQTAYFNRLCHRPFEAQFVTSLADDTLTIIPRIPDNSQNNVSFRRDEKRNIQVESYAYQECFLNFIFCFQSQHPGNLPQFEHLLRKRETGDTPAPECEQLKISLLNEAVSQCTLDKLVVNLVVDSLC